MNNIMIPADPCPLTGVLHIPQKPIGKTLIISHGFRGSKDGGGRAVKLAEAVTALGFTVIRYDFTPLQNLSRQIAELRAVIGYVRQTIGGQLFLLGRSMGGSASLAAAAADKENTTCAEPLAKAEADAALIQQKVTPSGLDKKISGLILWATPWDLTATFRLALGPHYEQLVAGKKLSVKDEYGSLELTPDFIRNLEHHNILEYIRQLGRTPLLILHGLADTIVPVSQAHKIYEAALGPKELVLYPDGDHHLAAYAGQASFTITNWLKNFK